MIIVTPKHNNKSSVLYKKQHSINLESSTKSISPILKNKINLSNKTTRNLEVWKSIGATKLEVEWLTLGISC